MSEKELYELLLTLDGINGKVAYDHFIEPNTTPPFILYSNTDSTTIKADDRVAILDNNYIVDLVTTIKDTTLEKSLETIFDNNYIPYDKEETYIGSERIYQIRYFI